MGSAVPKAERFFPEDSLLESSRGIASRRFLCSHSGSHSHFGEICMFSSILLIFRKQSFSMFRLF